MIINFDNSATTFPKPLSVRRAVYRAVETLGGNAGRGGHQLAMKSSSAVYSARETVAEFFGAEPENVIFTLNCTHALNMAIQGVMKDGGHLIISGIEHNSSARPAVTLASEKKIRLSIADVYPDSSKTIESFRRLITRDTKAAVCTIAGNVTGQIMPYREIARLCRENNICFIADGAQACGVLDINIINDGINILCTAGHKGLYGIMGTGLLVTDGKFRISPIIQGGTGTMSESLKQPELLPESLESGTLNTVGAVSVKAGIEFVKSKGVSNIFSHEDKICKRFIREIQKDDRIVVYRHPQAEYVPIVAFNMRNVNPEKLSSYLSEKGYCLRAGFHCSALAHIQLGTKNGCVRFSPSVFSREEDAVRLAEVIRKFSVQIRN